MLTKADVLALLKAKIAEAGTVASFAKANGLSPQYVHDVLHQRRGPSKKLTDALGLVKMEDRWRKK